MIIRIGAVYQMKRVDFVASVDKVDTDTNEVVVRLVNIRNWFSLGTRHCKQLTAGTIDCPDLVDNEVALVAKSVRDYFVMIDQGAAQE